MVEKPTLKTILKTILNTCTRFLLPMLKFALVVNIAVLFWAFWIGTP